MTMIALRSGDSAQRATENMPCVCSLTRMSDVTRGSTGAALSRRTTTDPWPRAARMECAAASASDDSVVGSASTRYIVRPLTSATRTYASHPARSSESTFATARAVSGYDASWSAMTRPVTAARTAATVSAAAVSPSLRVVSRSPHARSATATASALPAPIPRFPSAPTLGMDSLHRTLRRRHPLAPAHQCVLLRTLHLGLDIGLDVGQRRARHAVVHQILLIQCDRVAPPPLGEELGVESLPRFRLVVRRVPAHAKGLGDEKSRPVAAAAALDGQRGKRVRVEHVVPVELAAPHPIRARPIGEGRRIG